MQVMYGVQSLLDLSAHQQNNLRSGLRTHTLLIHCHLATHLILTLPSNPSKNPFHAPSPAKREQVLVRQVKKHSSTRSSA